MAQKTHPRHKPPEPKPETPLSRRDVLRRPVRLWLLLALFLGGFGLRMIGITGPPLNFHSPRQYRSALIARRMYYQTSAHVDDAKRQVVIAACRTEGMLEPPIMEVLAAIS